VCEVRGAAHGGISRTQLPPAYETGPYQRMLTRACLRLTTAERPPPRMATADSATTSSAIPATGPWLPRDADRPAGGTGGESAASSWSGSNAVRGDPEGRHSGSPPAPGQLQLPRLRGHEMLVSAHVRGEETVPIGLQPGPPLPDLD
jgi:hypothetical protein